ncbi:MAG: hypothetical protein IJM75_03560 [Ruminococcus sp.]|nr:hypothetical protein [Ruminococcus sp.]
MKRVYFCIFILMVVVAVSFFSLVRVSRGSGQLKTGIEQAQDSFRMSGEFPKGAVTALVSDWKDFYKSISFAENTNELNDISRLFTELENSKDEKDFILTSELIKTSLTLLLENESPHWYSLL